MESDPIGLMAGMAPVGRNEMIRFGVSVVAGGTISEITGGKFANGAASAAMRSMGSDSIDSDR